MLLDVSVTRLLSTRLEHRVKHMHLERVRWPLLRACNHIPGSVVQLANIASLLGQSAHKLANRELGLMAVLGDCLVLDEVGQHLVLVDQGAILRGKATIVRVIARR